MTLDQRERLWVWWCHGSAGLVVAVGLAGLFLLARRLFLPRLP